MRLTEIKPLGLGEYRIELEGTTVHFLFEVGSLEQTLFKRWHEEQVLFEAQPVGKPLVGTYSAILHKGHGAGGQDHLHVFAKRNQLFALNKDGTAHDASHGARIPNRVAQAIRSKFPQFKIPDTGVIEGVMDEELYEFYTALFEEGSEGDEL